MIDYEKRIVIVHPPRCGGTTAESAIGGDDLFKSHPFEKHLNAREIAYHLVACGHDPAAFRWIGLIRHPVDRAGSMFRSGHWSHLTLLPRQSKSSLSSIQFIALLRPACHERKNLSLSDYYNRGQVEFLPVEKLSDFLLREYNHPPERRLEISERKPFSPSPLFIAVVEWRFRRDFANFGYSRSRPFGVATHMIGAVVTFLYRFLYSLAQIAKRVVHWKALHAVARS